jgi:prepilin-type N-terminal cleavage/methylation domain-containing protein
MKRNGYSLIELMIVMTIFSIITMISGLAFQTIFTRTSLEAKNAETGVMGILGLEMMRADIAQAGFGLPWSYGTLPVFPAEVTGPPAAGLLDSTVFTSLDDCPTNSSHPVTAPWPVLSATGGNGIDYLVVKSSVGGLNPTSRRWNFVQYSSSGTSKSYLKTRGDTSTDLVPADQVVTLGETFSPSGVATKQLVVGTGGAFSYAVPATLIPPSDYQPVDPTQIFVAYGINGSNVRMPYNRQDYYVNLAAAKPKSCNPGTGVLFKGVADQQGGYKNYPLLDCVGDLQIVYDRDVNGDGTNIVLTDESVLTGLRNYSTGGGIPLTVDQMRSQVKNVRVYLLSHDGKKDPNFSYPDFDASYSVCVAPFDGTSCSGTVGRRWTAAQMQTAFGTDWRHYRWKVYSFVVNLKNLQ